MSIKVLFLLIQKKIDGVFLACPPKSFFYNGSCYFYLPPIQPDNLKGVRFNDVTIDEGKNERYLYTTSLV